MQGNLRRVIKPWMKGVIGATAGITSIYGFEYMVDDFLSKEFKRLFFERISLFSKVVFGIYLIILLIDITQELSNRRY